MPNDDLRTFWSEADQCHVLTPEDVRRCIDANPVATDELAKRGKLRVTGTIYRIRLGALDGKYLDLPEVTCHFDQDDGAAFVGLRAGDEVTGEGERLGGCGSIRHCVLVENVNAPASRPSPRSALREM